MFSFCPKPVDANKDLIVVENVGHGGLQRVRIQAGCDVSRARRQRNKAVDILEVGLCHRIDGRDGLPYAVQAPVDVL